MSERMSVDPALFEAMREAGPSCEKEFISQFIDEHYAGKRDALRTYRFLDLEVSGEHGTFRGMAVDISRSGMLMRITDPHFATEAEAAHLMTFTARVWYHFEGGVKVRFGEANVSADGSVVRVTGYCGPGASLILIGVRFKHMLGEHACERLAIAFADDRAPGAD